MNIPNLMIRCFHLRRISLTLGLTLALTLVSQVSLAQLTAVANEESSTRTGALTELNGSLSTDADGVIGGVPNSDGTPGLIYAWTHDAGNDAAGNPVIRLRANALSTTTIAEDFTANPSIPIPPVAVYIAPSTVTIIVFTLTVTDPIDLSVTSRTNFGVTVTPSSEGIDAAHKLTIQERNDIFALFATHLASAIPAERETAQNTAYSMCVAGEDTFMECVDHITAALTALSIANNNADFVALNRFQHSETASTEAVGGLAAVFEGRGADISWTRPVAAPIPAFYRVEYGIGDAPVKQLLTTIAAPNDETTFSVRHTLGGTEDPAAGSAITYRVTPLISKFREGIPADVTTTEIYGAPEPAAFVPPSPPRNLRADTDLLTQTQIGIAWDAPANFNDGIGANFTGYRVQITSDGMRVFTDRGVTGDIINVPRGDDTAAARTLTITSLTVDTPNPQPIEPGVIYYIRVMTNAPAAAMRSDWDNDSTNIDNLFSVATPAAGQPTPPRALAGDPDATTRNSVTLTWQSPAASNGNAYTGYFISTADNKEFRAASGGQSPDCATSTNTDAAVKDTDNARLCGRTDPNDLTAAVVTVTHSRVITSLNFFSTNEADNLKAGTPYYFRVRTRGGARSSELSAPVALITAAAIAPPVPSALTLTYAATGTSPGTTINWTASPPPTGQKVDEYIVERRVGSDDSGDNQGYVVAGTVTPIGTENVLTSFIDSLDSIFGEGNDKISGARIHYRVYAVSNSNVSTVASDGVVTTVDTALRSATAVAGFTDTPYEIDVAFRQTTLSTATVNWVYQNLPEAVAERAPITQITVHQLRDSTGNAISNFGNIARTALTFADTRLGSVTGVIRYRVRVSTVATGTGSSIPNAQLNAAGESPSFTPSTFTAPVVLVLTSPASLTFDDITDTSITLRWPDPRLLSVIQPDGYRIQRRVGTIVGTPPNTRNDFSGSDPFAVLVEDTGNTDTSYVDTGLTLNTAYQYHIVARSGDDVSTPPRRAAQATLAAPESFFPRNLRTTRVDATRVDLIWDAPATTPNVERITGYRIERDDGAGGAFATLFIRTDPNRLFTDDGDPNAALPAPVAETTYNYRVAAVGVNNPGAVVVNGEFDDTATIEVITLQGAPTNISSGPSSTDQVRVTWEPPSGSEVTGYDIDRRLATQTDAEYASLVRDLDRGDREYLDLRNVEGSVNLEDDLTYSYRIRATNANADGAWSTDIGGFLLALPETPRAPINFRATARTHNTVTFRWNASTSTTSEATAYQLFRAPFVPPASFGAFAPIGGNIPGNDTDGFVFSYTDTTVTANNRYNYRLRGINDSVSGSVVDGNFTSVVDVTTPNIPVLPAPTIDIAKTKAGPSDPTTGSSIDVVWDAVNSSSGYKLQRGGGGGTGFSELTVSADSRVPLESSPSHRDTGLLPNTTYQYRLRVSNSAGDSAFSPTVSVASGPVAVPLAPPSIGLSFATDGRVIITWAEIPNGGAAITPVTHYTVERRQGTSGPFAVINSRVVFGSNIITDSATLIPNTLYEFRVAGRNATGIGAYTMATITTDTGPAEQPTGLSADAVDGETRIDLSWTAPTENGGSDISGYRIQRAVGNGAFTDLVTDTTNTATSHMDSDSIVAGTRYRYQVAALTNSGATVGTYSAVANAVGDNRAPTAEAGNNATLDENAVVTLNGSASSDPDGGGAALTYRWSLSGSADVPPPGDAAVEANISIGLQNANRVQATFTAPNRDKNYTLTFSLTVTDVLGEDSAPDTVVITITAPNSAPIADTSRTVRTVTASVSAANPRMATLDARASSDPDTASLSYTWSYVSSEPTLPNAPAVTAVDGSVQAGSPLATFVVPTREVLMGLDVRELVLTLRLQVDDGDSATDANIEITVRVDSAAEVVTQMLLPNIASTVAAQHSGIISHRIEAVRTGDSLGSSRAKFGGQSFAFGEASDVGEASDATTSVNQTALANWLVGNKDSLVNGNMDMKRMLGDSSFVMPLKSSGFAGGLLSNTAFWGSGDYRDINAEAENAELGRDLEYDGNVFSLQLGVDKRFGSNWLGGVALSIQQGRFDYVDVSSGSARNEFNLDLTSIAPYVGWKIGPVDVWGSISYGRGELEIIESGESPNLADVNSQSLSLGASGLLWENNRGIKLRVKGDATLNKLDIERNEAAQIAASSVETNQTRVLVEISQGYFLEDGSHFEPSLELGLRHDAGADADGGTGLLVGAGVKRTFQKYRVTVEGNVHSLLGRDDYEESGVSGFIRILPGRDGQGLSLNFTPSYGEAFSGAESVWQQGWFKQTDDKAAASTGAQLRLKTSLGFGFASRRTAGLYTPYAESNYSDNSQSMRLGMRWKHDNLGLDLSGAQQANRNQTYQITGKLHF